MARAFRTGRQVMVPVALTQYFIHAIYPIGYAPAEGAAPRQESVMILIAELRKEPGLPVSAMVFAKPALVQRTILHA